MRFKYVAYTTSGEETTGVVEADSEERAEELLWQSNLTVTSLSRKMALPPIEEVLPTIFGVKRQDLVTFSRDLASLLAAGIALLLALRMLQTQAQKGSLRRIIQSLVTSIETGNSFSQACAEHPTVFPSLFLRVVEIGEEIGSLDLVLRQITTHYEKELALQARIRSALTYPTMVLVLAIGAIFVMVNFVLPAMMGLFTEFKAELPLATRILMALAGALKKFGPLIIIGIIALVFIIYLYTKTPGGSRRKDYFWIGFPVIGDIIKKENLSRLARTMVILLKAGVPLTEALRLQVQTTQNAAFRDGLLVVDRGVRGGQLLSQALASHPVFPPLLVQMSAVGEQTGRIETNLENLADYYEQEADRTITRLTGLIEPILIIGVGGVVGFIAVSVITPMYGIIHQIK